MYLRHDKVIRRQNGEDDQVFSLIADDTGLYVIHTGNVGGLLNMQANAQADPVVLDETTRPWVEEIFNNEAKLQTVPLLQLANKGQSTFLPYDAIQSAEGDTDAAQPHVILRTAQGVFDLVFTYSTGDQVRELLDIVEKRGR
jgi:hypothetical protein